MEGGDIIVTGIRESVSRAVDKKRTARQIVDTINAEDAGKLPDNNVVDALARVTGVSITRSRGQGDGFLIRGLAGVQTTVNGAEIGTAGGRTLDFSNLPSELVKSVEVYKTRTADQIEGGIGGTVNVELRRPLDLRNGWTVAGSSRWAYNEQGPTWSPFTSLLVANRFDTGIGEIGFLVNGALNEVKYDEAFTTTESPFLIGGDNSVIRQSLPVGVRSTARGPYRAFYAVDRGSTTQKSLSVSTQWAPSPQLNFVLEGSYNGSRSENQFNNFNVLLREDYYTIQNPRVGPGDVLLGYDILNLPNAAGNSVNFGRVAAFAEGGQSRDETGTYRVNFETHWNAPGVRIDGDIQYQWSKNDTYSNGHGLSFTNLRQVRVDFDAPETQGYGPFFRFNGVDITDPTAARVQNIRDNVGYAKNNQLSANLKLWKEVSATGLLRSLEIGSRYNRFQNDFGSSYRWAGWFDPATQPTLSAFPGVSTEVVTPNLRGAQPFSWIQLNSRQFFDNWDSVRRYAITTNQPEALDGPGRDNGVEQHFATARPGAEDAVFAGQVNENTFATYGILNYAFRALFPVDGNVGVRYVNTFSSLAGRSIQLAPPIRDPQTNLPIPGQFGPNRTIIDNARVNFVDILPSAYINVNFTEKFKLRGAYSYNVQRPSLGDLRSFRLIEFNNTGAPVNAGNPELGPTTTNDYNLSLEWYFGRGGILSISGFSKRQDGFIAFTCLNAAIPELDGQSRLLCKPRNAGSGRTEGVEFQATGFFSFLPGFLSNFGATVNGTWIPTAWINLPLDGPNNTLTYVQRRSPFTSRFTYNLIAYYETPQFSARVAYNRRSSFQTGLDAVNTFWIQTGQPQSRLDAAVNFTPIKYLTLSVEGQNLTGNIDRYTYYDYPALSGGYRSMGRQIQFSGRFRF